MLGQRLRRWATIEPALGRNSNKYDIWANAGSMLGQRRTRCANNKPQLGHIQAPKPRKCETLA